MEINKLITTLEETISLLQNSRSSDRAAMLVEEIIHDLRTEIAKAKAAQPIDTQLLGFLFAPAGPIQETSLENSWGDDFLRLSEIIDELTGT